MLGLLTRPERRHLSQTNNLCQHIYEDGIIVRKGSFWHKIDVFPADFQGIQQLRAVLQG